RAARRGPACECRPAAGGGAPPGGRDQPESCAPGSRTCCLESLPPVSCRWYVSWPKREAPRSCCKRTVIDRARRRRRAKQLMDGLTVSCVTLALAVGTGQLVKEGLQEFLFRPPGVGASPSEADTANANAAPTLPPIVEVIPPAPPPLLRPVERSRRHHGDAPYR